MGVCVTGAGGYVASWLVKLLLSKGHKVHGTVRDPGDEKNSHLKRLEKAQENLRLFKANLLDYNSLCAATAGCRGVFHIASPVPSSILENPETEVVETAVRGTLNVLKACSETGVERVVIVSSTAAVVNNPNWPPNRPMDEECWSDIDYCRKSRVTAQNVQPNNDQPGSEWIYSNQMQQDILICYCPHQDLKNQIGGRTIGVNDLVRSLACAVRFKTLVHTIVSNKWYNWYCISKTASEREALEYSEKSGLDVVTVCPSRILGPLLQPTVNSSSQLFIELFKGGVETIDDRIWVIVDVRDVTEALLLVHDKKEASGRYICASHPVRVQSMVEKLKNKYPYYSYPKNYIKVDQEVKLSSEKLKRFGWECRSLDETIFDTVEYCREAGILNED